MATKGRINNNSDKIEETWDAKACDRIIDPTDREKMIRSRINYEVSRMGERMVEGGRGRFGGGINREGEKKLLESCWNRSQSDRRSPPSFMRVPTDRF